MRRDSPESRLLKNRLETTVVNIVDGIDHRSQEYYHRYLQTGEYTSMNRTEIIERVIYQLCHHPQSHRKRLSFLLLDSIPEIYPL